MSTVSTVTKYKKRCDFSTEEQYRKYVQTFIKPGVKVRRINGDVWTGVKQGETGVVTEVYKRSDVEWEICADWEHAGRNVWGGLCQDMELID